VIVYSAVITKEHHKTTTLKLPSYQETAR